MQQPQKTDDDKYTVVQEAGFIKRPGQPAEVFEAVTCVLNGLAHLHKEKLVHRWVLAVLAADACMRLAVLCSLCYAAVLC